MAKEDFTTYIEDDSGSDITVIADRITVDTMQRIADSNVRKSFGSDHFADFEHLIDIFVDSIGSKGAAGCWGTVNNNQWTMQDRYNLDEGLDCHFYGNLGAPIIYIEEYNGDIEDYASVALDVMRYLTIERLGSVLTCKIFSDVERTSQVGSTLACACSTTAYEFIVPVSSREASGTDLITFFVENLDLQEAPSGESCATCFYSVPVGFDLNDPRYVHPLVCRQNTRHPEVRFPLIWPYVESTFWCPSHKPKP